MNVPQSHSPQRGRDAEYYLQLHTENTAYQQNNWLVEELGEIRKLGGAALLEVGCGNGRFLALAAAHYQKVVGCDWVESPLIREVLQAHPNVEFSRVNLLDPEFPLTSEVLVSADVMEHLPPESLRGVLRRLTNASPRQFHKIACYDDGHSHDSVFSPEDWLALFRERDRGYRILRVDLRHGDPAKQIVCIGKAP